MAQEIERKFLVISEEYRSMAISKETFIQAYLCSSQEGMTVRLRIFEDRAELNIKSATSADGISRDEWEYPISKTDALSMLQQPLKGRLEKERYIVPFEGKRWEVDCFHGNLEGLVMAEIELTSVDEKFTFPPFIGKEVTGNSSYFNANLAQKGLPSEEESSFIKEEK